MYRKNKKEVAWNFSTLRSLGTEKLFSAFRANSAVIAALMLSVDHHVCRRQLPFCAICPVKQRHFSMWAWPLWTCIYKRMFLLPLRCRCWRVHQVSVSVNLVHSCKAADAHKNNNVRRTLKRGFAEGFRGKGKPIKETSDKEESRNKSVLTEPFMVCPWALCAWRGGGEGKDILERCRREGRAVA